MQYRPQSINALLSAVEVVRKRRLRERYLGDLLWMAAKSQYVDFPMAPFSEYDDLLEGKMSNAEAEKEKISQRVEEMLNMYG